MNMLERLIDRNKKLLKEMTAHPDPKQMKSTRLALELEIDGFSDLLEAWQQDKPILTYFPSAGIARAMGALHALDFDILLSMPDPELGAKLYQVAHDMGMPDYMCDVFTLPAAAVKAGLLPPPIVATSGCGGSCRVWIYHMKTFAEYFDVPTFDIDTPHGYDEESIKYLAGQLGELIKFVEKHVPGLEYDEDKHKEIIKANRAWVSYFLKEYELRKNIPLPLNNMEVAFPLHFDPSQYGEREKVLNFWRQRVQDIEQRVAKGVKREEKLRILWLDAVPLYIDPFSILERLGVSLTGLWVPPMGAFNGWRANWGDEKEFGRRLTPLEEEARYILGEGNYDEGSEYAENVVKMCKDWSCDAVIHYQPVGCLHIGGMARLINDTVERKLGLPTLTIQGKLYDQALLPPAELESRLTDFIDMVLARKG